jgi:hypothetical protein
MIKPVAGDEMAFLCVDVILGGKNPWIVEAISSAAVGDAVSDEIPAPIRTLS